MVEYRASASAGSVGTSRPSNQPVAVPAEEHAVDHRLELARLDRGAGTRCDRFGGYARLLCGDAAVLDREVGRVAGGEH